MSLQDTFHPLPGSTVVKTLMLRKLMINTVTLAQSWPSNNLPSDRHWLCPILKPQKSINDNDNENNNFNNLFLPHLSFKSNIVELLPTPHCCPLPPLTYIKTCSRHQACCCFISNNKMYNITRKKLNCYWYILDWQGGWESYKG